MDDQCGICPHWDDCTDCIDLASPTGEDGDCVCNSGYVYDIAAFKCVMCHEACAICDSAYFFDCTECKDGFFLQRNSTICLAYCPSGTIPNEELNICETDDSDDVAFCANFESKLVVVQSAYDITIVNGSDPDGPDSSDPIPIYLRGLYFDGVDDYLTINNLVLSSDFTLTMWIRANGGTTLFSISRASYRFETDEDIMMFGVGQSTDPGESNTDPTFLVFSFTPITETPTIHFTDPNQAYAYLQWSFISMRAEWDNELRITNVRMGSDGFPRGDITFDDVIQDNISHIHMIGAEFNTQNGLPVLANLYNGFIFEFCIYSAGFDIFEDLIADNSLCPIGDRCLVCPYVADTATVCLIDCEWDEFLNDDGFCTDCIGCDNGCLSAASCGGCIDKMCKVCEEWIVCTECMDNASIHPQL